MTAILPEVTDLPDLDAAVPCECPGEGHGDEGCQSEAKYRAAYPCGHQAELLCGKCTSDILLMIADGCPDCDGPYYCQDCDEPIEHLDMRPL